MFTCKGGLVSEVATPENNWTGDNISRWCDPTYDDLFSQASVEPDSDKRQQLFMQMNDLLIENVVIIPLVRRPRISGIGNDITGVELTPWDSHLWNIEDWRRVP